jgi:hypothetical protein
MMSLSPRVGLHRTCRTLFPNDPTVPRNPTPPPRPAYCQKHGLVTGNVFSMSIVRPGGEVTHTLWYCMHCYIDLIDMNCHVVTPEPLPKG